MGGKGSGGARVGAGRPEKSAAQHIFEGTAQARHRAEVARPKAPPEFVPEPVELSRGASQWWQKLAPRAMEQRTLTQATVEDMRLLCEMRVEADELLAERRREGWNARGIKLAGAFRMLVQRIEAKERGFRLAPIGKEMTATAPAETDPWAEFDTPGETQ